MGVGPYTVKKVIDFPVPSREVTNQTLPGRELFNYSRPGRVWLVTSRLGTEKAITFFTVYAELSITSTYVDFRINSNSLQHMFHEQTYALCQSRG